MKRNYIIPTQQIQEINVENLIMTSLPKVGSGTKISDPANILDKKESFRTNPFSPEEEEEVTE